MRILIIDSDKALSEKLEKLLNTKGYLTDAVYDGLSGLDYILSGIYDLIIMETSLPKLDGLDVIKNIRRQNIHTPVIIISINKGVEAIIQGLDMGADDYITKPINQGELLARIRARTRSVHKREEHSLSFEGISLSRETMELVGKKGRVKLGNKEFQLLEALLINAKQIVPKDMLIEKVWGPFDKTVYNQLEVYICFLRKKLKAVSTGVTVKTTKNVGYELKKAEQI